MLNLKPSKHLIFSPPVLAMKAFPCEKVTITTFLPLRKEKYKPRTEYRAREGMTLKEVERHLGDTAVY